MSTTLRSQISRLDSGRPKRDEEKGVQVICILAKLEEEEFRTISKILFESNQMESRCASSAGLYVTYAYQAGKCRAGSSFFGQ